jgi:cytochrome oxidase Cu insertion factor (SCO1/SenC/PrrC family)
VSPRAKVALILAVCVAPAVIAWLAYEQGWGSGRAANYGELVQPRRLDGPLAALRGKWVLVTFDDASCAPPCERKLYVVRQARLALGKDAGRVERLWLLIGSGQPGTRLLAAIEGARVVASSAELERAFAGDVRSHIYLVDPLGNLMMRYPSDADPARLIRDLERLMKYSSIG